MANMRAPIAFLALLMILAAIPVAAQTQATIPVLQYNAPPNYMRSAIYPPEDYIANQFNGSFQVYQFEPFAGNIVQTFQRTLLKDRISAMHVEENVVGIPQFRQAKMPGADAVYVATFTENRVGIPRPHMRILIVKSGFAAIFDVGAINPQMYQRITPDVNAVLGSMRVESAPAPPSVSEGEGPGPLGETLAGLYKGVKQKFMTGLTFQASYYTTALHFYLLSKTGQVYRAYDQVRAPGGDITRFDFAGAQRAEPQNVGRFTVKNDKLYIQIGKPPAIVTDLPKDNVVTIESVTYVRQ